MKRHLLAGVAGASFLLSASQALSADLAPAPVVAPEPALPLISAVLSIYGGGVFPHSNDSDFKKNGYELGGDGRISGQHWLFGVHTNYISNLTDSSGNDGEGALYGSLEGHGLFDSDWGAWGLFVAMSASRWMDTTDGGIHIYPGIEMLFDEGNAWAFYGQFGGAFCTGSDDCTDSWQRGVWGRGGLRYFFSDYTKFEGDVTLAGGYFDDGDRSGNYGFVGGWGAEIEHQFNMSPFAGFAAYRGTYSKDSDCSGSSCDVTDHAFLVGFRIRTQDLRSTYSDGADRFNLPHHHFKRWVAFPDEL